LPEATLPPRNSLVIRTKRFSAGVPGCRTTPVRKITFRIAGASAPLRVVMGERDIPKDFNLHQGEGETIFLKSRDVSALIDTLADKPINQVLVEAGPTLGTALLKAGVIDEILIYQAPVLLGSGKSWITDLGINTIKDGMSLTQISTEQIGPDLKSRYRVGAH
jgi:diaminohydroxyphosphoribosylaminopyrimidine deaminase/5-amino-6-(5-phosphoribosylamino)uracil reductase